MLRTDIILFFAILFFTSCTENNKNNRGAIVLGDPETIVTEIDSQYLLNSVSDIKINTESLAEIDEFKPETVTKPTDPVPINTEPVNRPTENITTGKGLKVPFKELTIFIPNIDTRSYRTQNLKTSNGASYQLTEGKLQGNQLRISGSGVRKVSQRYTTVILAKNNSKTLELDALENTTEWETISGSGNVYPIKGLESNRLKYKAVSPQAIKNAVNKAARDNRYSRKEIQEWESSVRNIKAANQKPLSVVLQSVMWKIEGKDAKGKSYRKELRIDMPL